MAVLQFPGPDGVRPITLAERAGMSKQAMNQLLRSLEGFGYIVRSNVTDGGSARQIRFTERGHAAFWKMVDILRDIEREWSIELGQERFAQLKALLFVVWDKSVGSLAERICKWIGSSAGSSEHPSAIAGRSHERLALLALPSDGPVGVVRVDQPMPSREINTALIYGRHRLERLRIVEHVGPTHYQQLYREPDTLSVRVMWIRFSLSGSAKTLPLLSNARGTV